MQIMLISGFLGAGKTTFIKELIKRTDKRPVIMENEYGDNTLDSLELKNASSKKDELKILEFMEGCVCCTMKDSFVNSVFTVYSSMNPEYLIIEPTGVGRLSRIIENLQPITKGDISLLEPMVVISPLSYHQNMKEYPELYTDQIANAKRVIFSKCENADQDELDSVAGEIRSINPEAEILTTHYTKMDADWWEDVFRQPEGSTGSAGGRTSASDKRAGGVTDASAAADSFAQVTITQGGFHNPAQLIVLLEDCLHGEFGLVTRAKGTLWVGSEMLRFDLADRMYAITDSPDDGCQCVFIGKFLDEKKLRDRLCEENRMVLRK
jgi:G3E family GTPase